MDQPAPPGAPSGSLPEPLPRAYVVGAAALLLLHVVLAWWVRQPAVLTGNDDALYILLGQALREFTYRDVHVFGQPWHAQYPPGYPFLLALFGGPLGLGITGPLVLGIALSALALLLVFDIARKFAPREFALALLATVAVNPLLIDYAGSVRSETAYMAASVAALWFLVRRADLPVAVSAGIGFTVFAALTRSAGLSLVVAVAATWILERRWTRVAGLTVAAALTLGLWLTWIFYAPQQFEARSYGVMLIQSAPTESSPFRLLLSQGLRTVNAYILRGSLGNALGLPRIPGTPLDNLLSLGLSGFLIVAGIVASWRRGLLITMYTVTSAGLLTVWTYKLTRFLIPIAPVLLLLACIGAAALVARRGRVVRGIMLAAFTGVFLIGGAQGVAGLHRAQAGCPHDQLRPPPACLNPIQQGFFQAVAFLRDSTPPEALVITTKEAAVALHTGRKVLHSQSASKLYGEYFVEGLRGAGEAYILLSRIHLWRVPEEMVARCSEFELVRSYPHGNDLVRLLPPGVTATDDRVCGVIRDHAAAFIPPLPRR